MIVTVVIIACFVAGAIGGALVLASGGPKLFSDAPVNTANAFFGWNLPDNLARSFHLGDLSMPWLPLVFILGCMGAAAWWAWTQPERRALWLTFGAASASVLCFAVLQETRASIFLLPFLVARVAA